MRGLHLLLSFLLLSALAVESSAEVYYSKEGALRMAFPEADHFDSETLVLDEQTAEAIESLSRTRLGSRLVKVHVAHEGSRIVGYAFIETHNVRSLPETVMVAIHPDGRTRGVHLLAFHEPKEYEPTSRWLDQFEGRPLDDEMSLRRGIAGIAGSTLTANAITAAVRRLLATFELAVGPILPDVDMARSR